MSRTSVINSPVVPAPEVTLQSIESSYYMGHTWTIQASELEGLVDLLTQLWDWICSLFASDAKIVDLKGRVEVQASTAKDPVQTIEDQEPAPVEEEGLPDRQQLVEEEHKLASLYLRVDRQLERMQNGALPKQEGPGLTREESKTFLEVKGEFTQALHNLMGKIQGKQKIKKDDDDLVLLTAATSALRGFNMQLQSQKISEALNAANRVIRGLRNKTLE